MSTPIPAIGLIGAGLGLYMENVWLIAPGILLIVLGALQMVNPLVVIERDKVEFRNIFGMVRAAYEHDGLELMEMREDELYIRKGQHIAHLRQLKPGRLHPSDWKHLKETLQKARELADKNRR